MLASGQAGIQISSVPTQAGRLGEVGVGRLGSFGGSTSPCEEGGVAGHSLNVEGGLLRRLGHPKVTVPEGCGAEHPLFPIFSGSLSSEKPDLGFVDENSVLNGSNPTNSIGKVGVLTGETPGMGAAMLDLAGRSGRERWRESLHESGDVTIQNGDGQPRDDESVDSGIGLSLVSCVSHGLDNCIYCEDIDVDSVLDSMDGYVQLWSSNGEKGKSPFYRSPESVCLPVVTPFVVRGDTKLYRPCGVLCTGSHRLEGIQVQLNPCVFFDECFNHESGVDQEADFIFKGVSEGFRIVDPDFDESYCRSNYQSITKGKAKVKMDELVRKELLCGKVCKVHKKPSCVHSLGAIHKPDGAIRPITDCSRGKSGPGNESINDHMSSTCSKFQYVKVDDIVEAITPGCYFSVVDVSAAYRAVPIHPGDRTKQGFMWNLDGEDEYYLDCSLSFGLKCAPFIFTKLTEFVIRCLKRRNIHRVYGYLDDFLVMGESRQECRESQAILIEILRSLGFHIAWKKVISASQVVRYLGIEFDSIAMELRLPSDKVQKTLDLVCEFKEKACCRKQELQVLAGYLAHASQVVRGGRTFSRRIINLIRFLPDGEKLVHIPQWMKEDLVWWKNFIEIFNGKAKVIQCSLAPSVKIETDSSMSGFGARWDGDWLAGVWSEDKEGESATYLDHHWAKEPTEYDPVDDINLLELWPVLAAVERWGDYWRNSKITVLTDNTQVKWMIATGRSKSIKAMWWLRELFWRCCVYNIQLVSKWISTKENTVADYLSRLSDPKSRGSLPPSFNEWLCCCR